jgi:hypothetical protein
MYLPPGMVVRGDRLTTEEEKVPVSGEGKREKRREKREKVKA